MASSGNMVNMAPQPKSSAVKQPSPSASAALKFAQNRSRQPGQAEETAKKIQGITQNLARGKMSDRMKQEGTIKRLQAEGVSRAFQVGGLAIGGLLGGAKLGGDIGLRLGRFVSENPWLAAFIAILFLLLPLLWLFGGAAVALLVVVVIAEQLGLM